MCGRIIWSLKFGSKIRSHFKRSYRTSYKSLGVLQFEIWSDQYNNYYYCLVWCHIIHGVGDQSTVLPHYFLHTCLMIWKSCVDVWKCKFNNVVIMPMALSLFVGHQHHYHLANSNITDICIYHPSKQPDNSNKKILHGYQVIFCALYRNKIFKLLGVWTPMHSFCK